MKFAFFGSSLVSTYWNRTATYYRGLLRQLHVRGHSITYYEPDIHGWQDHRDIDTPTWASVVVYPPTTDGVDMVLDHASTADVVIKISGVGFFDRTLEQGVLSLKRLGRTVVFWDIDPAATLDELGAIPGHPFGDLVPRFDLILARGGGEAVVAAYRRFGARQCVSVCNAIDPEMHYPVLPSSQFEAHLGFMGNRLPHREVRTDAFFFDVARKRPDTRFLLGGSGWDDKPLPDNVQRIGYVCSHNHNAFNVTPRAILHISNESTADYGFSPSARIFEAVGAGACLMSDAWEGLDRFLEPGREVLVAHHGEDVAAHLDSLDIDLARRIGHAARLRLMANHTYAHRALQIEALLEGIDTPEPST